MVNILVEPVSSSIVSVQIQIYNVELFNSLSAYIRQYNDENQMVKLNNITLTSEEYNGWLDDSELVSLLLNKVGLVKKQDEEEEKKEENDPVIEPQE
jgi:ribosome maturation factor RimP